MSLPTIQVLVGFEQTVDFATPFQLDSPTSGQLDNDTLGGIQMLDVTSMVKSISINRGRNRDTEQFNAGTASVVFYDPNRDLDPLNEDSPYYPFVGPRQITTPRTSYCATTNRRPVAISGRTATLPITMACMAPSRRPAGGQK